MNKMLRELCPPVLWTGLQRAKRKYLATANRVVKLDNPTEQDLGVYWDPQMAALLETWGTGTVWHEITYLMSRLQGRVLDIACGTGRNIQELRAFERLEIHGCDISDLLIRKATERGVAEQYLRVCDATQTGYPDNFFEYSYSIGSFEHFTERGLQEVIAEAQRISKIASFNMVPVSRSGLDEGWVKTYQSYWLNSVDWWREKFSASFPKVEVLDSLWQDDTAIGKWFICEKKS